MSRLLEGRSGHGSPPSLGNECSAVQRRYEVKRKFMGAPMVLGPVVLESRPGCGYYTRTYGLAAGIKGKILGSGSSATS